MKNLTKRQLCEMLESLREDDNISFVLAHDAVEGDIITVLGEHDPDYRHSREGFWIDMGNPDVLVETDMIKVSYTSNPQHLFRPETRSTL
jgi:hypothetical protein